MGKIALVIFISSILSKIIGFYREILIGQLYGVSAITDAFFISLTIPWTLFGVISTGLLSSYLPMYSSIYIKSKKNAEIFTSNIITIVTFFIVPIFYVCIYMYSYELVGLFGENLKQIDIERTVIFLRITSFVLFFTGVLAIWTGKLQYHNLFTVVPLSGILLNISIIVCVYISKYYSVYFLPLSIVLGNVVQFIIVLLYMKNKSILNYKFNIKYKSKDLGEFSKLILPIMISASSAQIIYFIDQIIASKTIVGGVSLINYTQKINEVFMQLFVVTIITIIFPKLSKIIGKTILFNRVLKQSVDVISFLCIPLVFFIVVNSKHLIEIVYGSNAFTNDELSQMSKLLVFYSISIIVIGYREILIKALFAKKISKMIMYLSMITLLINTTLSIQLSSKIGIIGIPISGLISSIVTVGIIAVYLNKKINYTFFNKKSIVFFLTTVLVSFLSVTTMILFENLFLNNLNVLLILISNFLIFLLIFLLLNFLTGYLKYIKWIVNQTNN